MDAVIGIQGNGFVIIATDMTTARSIQVLKTDTEKIYPLDNNKIMGAAGPVGDRTQFCEYVQKNLALYALRNGYELTVHSAVNFTRNELAYALRKGPYQVDLLMGGVDKKGPALYHMDYMGSCSKVSYSSLGYSSYFGMSILDRYCHANMSEAQAVVVINKVIAELQNRFMMTMPNFMCKIADANGIRSVDLSAPVPAPAPVPPQE